MNKYFTFLVLIALIPVALCGPRPKKNRGALEPLPCDTGDESAASPPVNLIVPLCESVPCILTKGETYDVEIDFDVPRDTNNLTVTVAGIIEGFELPWNGIPENGCDNIVVGWCPMREHDYWTYGVAIKVEAVYPSTPLIIKWYMRDDTGAAIWCFHLPAEIVA